MRHQLIFDFQFDTIHNFLLIKRFFSRTSFALNKPIQKNQLRQFLEPERIRLDGFSV